MQLFLLLLFETHGPETGRSRLTSGIATSRLSNDALCATQLTLDLLTSPASGLYRAWLEVAVGLGLLNHSRQPALAESVNKLAIGVGVSQVTKDGVSIFVLLRRYHLGPYPMTPIAALISDSLRLASVLMRLRSWKMAGTYC